MSCYNGCYTSMIFLYIWIFVAPRYIYHVMKFDDESRTINCIFMVFYLKKSTIRIFVRIVFFLLILHFRFSLNFFFLILITFANLTHTINNKWHHLPWILKILSICPDLADNVFLFINSFFCINIITLYVTQLDLKLEVCVHSCGTDNPISM